MEVIKVSEKKVYTNKGENVVTTTTDIDMQNLSPCNHEEADSRICIHAQHISANGYDSIMIRTIDSDIVVLVVSVYHELGIDKVWVAYNTGVHFSYIAIHEIAASIGPNKCIALPFFHALTGTDTTSAFQYKGKQTAWETWKSYPGVTNHFQLLPRNPGSIPEDTMRELQCFVILLYDHTGNEGDFHKVRKKLYTAWHDMDPPN